MSLQLPQRAAGSRRALRRLTLLAALGASTAVLAGCSAERQDEFKRLAMPEPMTEQGEHVLSLWQGAWIAAGLTGALVWGLIFWVIWRYRRRHADEVPIQTRYNLPLEIFYTIAPIMMVIVFFAQTVRVQNLILDDPAPDQTITVTAMKWSWLFNYPAQEVTGDANVFEEGTASYIPTLVIPVDSITRFELRSPDVVHSFSAPGFLMKMDVIPGRENHFQVTPTRTGTYAGKCFEFCGAYHSRMLFNLEVVSQEEYDAHLQKLADAGRVSDEPILGPADVRTEAGLRAEYEAEEADR